jgi:hypothetical protein
MGTTNRAEELNLIDYILYINSLTTAEFCDWQGVPRPHFTGDVKTSADLFLQIDTIKYRLCKEKAQKEKQYDNSRQSEIDELTKEVERLRKGIDWTRTEYIKCVNDNDEITEKLEELLTTH